MSLLLDARKKLLRGKFTQDTDSHSKFELSLEESPKRGADTASSDDIARGAGKNLFKAKSSVTSLSGLGNINRNLMLALGGTLILLISGAGYVWYVISDSDNPPLRYRASAIAKPAVPLVTPAPTPITVAAAPETVISAKPPTVPANSASISKKQQANKLLRKKTPNKKIRHTPQPRKPIHLKPRNTKSPESLIDNAYLAYRAGKLNESRQMYLDILGKNPRNIDALLGLAAISQQLGEDNFATRYYLRALALDPRNAVANAGMSMLNMNESSESRLKSLLREQNDSAALHFALGNIYAKQSRWGKAQLAYFDAYTLDANNAELSLNLAVSLDHLGQTKYAVQYYQRALQLDNISKQPHSFNHAQISQRVEELTR